MLRNNPTTGHTPRPVLSPMAFMPGVTGNRRMIHFDEGDGDGTPPPGGGDGGGDDEVKFDEKQQAHFDKTLQKRLGQEQKKWDKEKAGLQTQLNELSEKVKGGDKDKDKLKDMIPKAEFESLKAQLESNLANDKKSLQERIASLLGDKKRGAVIDASVKHNVVDPKVVAKLVEDFIDFDDDGEMFVRKDDGKPRYGSSGDYMTVSEFLGEYLKDKPVLVKSAAGGGGGSNPSKTPAKSGGDVKLSPLEKIAGGLKPQA